MEGSTGAGHGESRDAVAARKRSALQTGLAVLGMFLLFPVLTAFTSVLDGTVGGIGIAYIAGFFEVGLALAVALRHARRGNTPMGA